MARSPRISAPSMGSFFDRYPSIANPGAAPSAWPTGRSAPRPARIESGVFAAAELGFPAQNALKALRDKPFPPAPLGQLRSTDGFISHLLGGPAPVKSPMGVTLGQYDHQIGQIGFDLSGKAAVVAPFVDPVLVAEAPGAGAAMLGLVRAGAAAGAKRAMVRGAALGGAEVANLGRMHAHHINPMFLGGAEDGARLLLPERAHIDYHRAVNQNFKNPGVLGWKRPAFERVGGTGGSTKVWEKYLEKHPARLDDAYTVLRQAARKIDRQYGTKIGEALNRELRPNQGRGRNAGVAAIPFQMVEEWRQHRKK